MPATRHHRHSLKIMLESASQEDSFESDVCFRLALKNLAAQLAPELQQMLPLIAEGCSEATIARRFQWSTTTVQRRKRLLRRCVLELK